MTDLPLSRSSNVFVDLIDKLDSRIEIQEVSWLPSSVHSALWGGELTFIAEGDLSRAAVLRGGLHSIDSARWCVLWDGAKISFFCFASVVASHIEAQNDRNGDQEHAKQDDDGNKHAFLKWISFRRGVSGSTTLRGRRADREAWWFLIDAHAIALSLFWLVARLLLGSPASLLKSPFVISVVVSQFQLSLAMFLP